MYIYIYMYTVYTVYMLYINIQRVVEARVPIKTCGEFKGRRHPGAGSTVLSYCAVKPQKDDRSPDHVCQQVYTPHTLQNIAKQPTSP